MAMRSPVRAARCSCSRRDSTAWRSRSWRCSFQSRKWLICRERPVADIFNVGRNRPRTAEFRLTMERDRIPELDLLRFTAAAGVVLFHATHWPAQPNLLTEIFKFGAMGV